MSDRICAAEGCGNPLPARPGRVGRPPIYCSPQCRPSRSRPVLCVEADHGEETDASSRDWEVRLRRGRRTVVLQRGLGRFSATALAAEVQNLLTGTGRS